MLVFVCVHVNTALMLELKVRLLRNEEPLKVRLDHMERASEKKSDDGRYGLLAAMAANRHRERKKEQHQ